MGNKPGKSKDSKKLKKDCKVKKTDPVEEVKKEEVKQEENDDLHKIHELFKQVSVDGRISKDEFDKLSAQQRPEFTEKLAKISQVIFKKETESSASFRVFSLAYAIYLNTDYKEKLLFLFNSSDVNNDGSLDKQEVKALLNDFINILGEESLEVPESTSQEFFKALDLDSDGIVTRDEFVKCLEQSLTLKSILE